MSKRRITTAYNHEYCVKRTCVENDIDPFTEMDTRFTCVDMTCK